MSPPISPPKNGSRNQKINKVDLLLCVKHTTRHRSPPDASLDFVTPILESTYNRLSQERSKKINPRWVMFLPSHQGGEKKGEHLVS